MPDKDGVIATHYRIDSTQPGPTLQGGLDAFRVVDQRDPKRGLLAVRMRDDLPARPRITLAQGGEPVAHVVLPLDYGPGHDIAGRAGWFIICDSLPGPALGVGGQGWRESELVACVLQPAAAALAGLQARGLTHRAINPENLFRAGPREKMSLGPFWAAPPGSLQPALYEPPYMARCEPTGRGEGSIADDVYALGVTLLVLAMGRVPLAELDAAALLHRKLVSGSYGALAGDAALTPLLADLLRGMLAEDPDHRPSPHLLLKPEQARARRVAARPPRRAQVALSIGGAEIWSARELAHGLGLRPDHAYRMLKNGEVERWLRRCLGDPPLGMRVEEVIRQADDLLPEDGRRQNMLVMRAVAAIDPLAPLVWRGLGLFPDALGSMLVGAGAERRMVVEEIITTEAVSSYLTVHERRHGGLSLIEEQRGFRGWLAARGPAGGIKRLLYAANPLLGCASPLLGGRPVIRIAELLQALDDAAFTADQSRPPIDADIAAFIAARADQMLSADIRQIGSFAGPADRLAVLRTLGQIQSRLQPGKLPGLAGWLVKCGFASLTNWHSHKTRAALQERLAQAVAAGNVAEIAALMNDSAGRRADQDGAAAAAAQIGQLEAALAASEARAGARARAAERLTYECMTGLSLIACMGAVLMLALR